MGQGVNFFYRYKNFDTSPIDLYQLNHQLSPYQLNANPIIGMIIRARIYDPNEVLTDLHIKLSVARLNILGFRNDGRVNLTIPTSDVDAQAITDRIEGRIEVKVFYLLADGSEIAIYIIDGTVSDFRFDIGAMQSTYTIVMRADFSTPVKADVLVTRYISKRRLLSDIGGDVYVYSIDFFDFRKLSIGANFQEDTVIGVISEITLTLAFKRFELLVEVEV